MPRGKYGDTLSMDVIIQLRRLSYNNLNEMYKKYGPSFGSGYEMIDGKQRRRVGSGRISMSRPTFYKAMRGEVVADWHVREMLDLASSLQLVNSDGRAIDSALSNGVILKLMVLIGNLEKKFTAENLENVLVYSSYYKDHILELSNMEYTDEEIIKDVERVKRLIYSQRRLSRTKKHA